MEKKEFTLLPEGEYFIQMKNFEEVETKNGKGRHIKAAFEIVDGVYKNRLIFDSFLTEHESAKAVEVGQARLNNYLKAVGLNGGMDAIGHDTTQLAEYLGMPLVAKVKIQKGTPYKESSGRVQKGKDQNKIVTFKMR